MLARFDLAVRFLEKNCALWSRGVWHAIQVQRSLYFCVREGEIFKKCTRSALLNGVVFYGSLLWAERVLNPLVTALVSGGMRDVAGERAIGATTGAILWTYDMFWMFPIYLISFLVSVVWSQDVAELALEVREVDLRNAERKRNRSGDSPSDSQKNPGKTHGDLSKQPNGKTRSPALLDVYFEKLCTMVVLYVFWMEVQVVGCLPVVGPSLELLFTAWLMAFYCFDYAWSINGVALERRIATFENNWAFFWGFGTPLALLINFTSFYTSAMLSGGLFPISVLIACGIELADIEGFDKTVGVEGGVDRKQKSGQRTTNHPSLLSIFGLAMRIASFLINGAMGKSAWMSSIHSKFNMLLVKFSRG
ncbi:hypothetical protein BSKO_11024 [Bryopsis sp. KO-2023]|nr:hypothetical protein BSKO_11024 [Bryopsis sp. KO-2023]